MALLVPLNTAVLALGGVITTTRGSRSSSRTTSGEACGAYQDCGTCLVAANDNNVPCFWCYSSKSCQAVDPSLSGLLSGKTFNGCADFSLDAATCKCRPSVYTSCGDCATAEHPTCVWMPNGTMTTTIQLETPSGGVHTTSWSTPVGGRCMDGTGFGPSGAEMGGNLTFDTELIGQLSTAYSVAPAAWFWGQCTVPGPGMAGGLIALCVLLCCAASCACRRCSRRRRRDRMPFTITVTADGKSKKECMPMYYCVPCCMSSLCCKGAIDKTAKNATEVAGGAPQATEMER